jgi:hypothetical protein
MIRSLRRRHFLFSLLMVFGLPLMVGHGYLHSRREARVNQLPSLDAFQPGSYPLEVWHKPRLWRHFPLLRTRLLANTRPEHGLAVELFFEGTVSDPDVLLYWSPRAYSAKSGIGAPMHLLGKLSQEGLSLFPLPFEARHRDGFLVLYSLAEDRVISEALLVNPLKGLGGGHE